MFTWTEVFYPIYFVLGLWLVVLFFILVNKETGHYVMKTPQSRALWLYMASLVCTAVFVIYFTPFLDCAFEDVGDAKDYCYDDFVFDLRIAFTVGTMGLFLFIIGVIICTDLVLAVVISRMGAERAKNLIRNADGGWDADVSYENFVLFGEIDVKNTVPGIGFKAIIFCRCQDTYMNS